MNCNRCGSAIQGTDKFCMNCGANLANQLEGFAVVSAQEKTSTLKKVVAGIGAFILVFGIITAIRGYSTGGESAEEASKKIYEDALSGTNIAGEENEAYVNALRQVFEYYKREAAAVVELDKKLAASDFLTATSFSSKPKIQGYIDDMKLYATVVEKLRVNTPQYKANARRMLEESDMPKSAITGALETFDKTSEDKLLNDLNDKRYSALVAWANATQELYQFAYDNFDDMVIQDNSVGEPEVAFYSDANADKYYDLAVNVDNKQLAFSELDQQVMTETNKKMNEYIPGSSAKDIQDYLYE